MLELFLLILVVCFTSLYPFQMYFQGYLIGDPFDTRLMINQHEHWFRFFSGESKLRDTFTFYPFDKALGYTDAFLVPGIIHSFFRSLGFSVLNSWSIATFAFFLIGNLGWVWVAQLILTKKISRLFFVISVSATPTMVLLLERAPNVAGYTWVSWLFFFTILGLKQLANKKSIHGFGAVLIILPLLMASSWYPAFFYLITVFTSLIIFVITKNIKTSFSFQKIRNYSKSITLLFWYVLFSSPLYLLWAYIHIPVASRENRAWNETIGHSTYLSQILNQNYLNNGWYYIFVKKFNYQPFQKSDFAIPIILIILTLFLVVVSYLLKNEYLNHYRNFLLYPGLLITLIFTRINEDFSFFKIFWDTIPGLYSIRFPYRYLIILSMIFLIFIYVMLDKSLRLLENRQIKKILIFIVFFILIIDLYKPPLNLWTKENFVPKALLNQQKEIKKNCDFFIVDRPGGWWDDQISAMSLSTLIAVPTANGYSGGFPPNYPVKKWDYEGDISEILEWTRFGQSQKKGCLVSDSHRMIHSSPDNLGIFIHSGFSSVEQDSKNNYWHWGIDTKSYFLINIPKNVTKYELTFEIKPAPCLKDQNIKLYKLPSNLILEKTISGKNQILSLTLKNEENSLQQFKFEVDNNFCNVENDSRDLFFEFKNFQVNAIETQP